MTIEEVFKSLDSNLKLTVDMKNHIKKLLTIIINSYPNIDLNALNSKIIDLDVIEEGKYSFDRVIDYNNYSNTIVFNSEKVQNYDQNNLLTNVLIKMCFSGDKEIEDKYKALYEGTAAQMANMLVGSDSLEVYNQDELYETNLISSIIENDKNTNILIDAFIARDYSRVSKETGIQFICDKMTYNYFYKKSSYGNKFAEIEKDLIQLLFSSKKDSSQIEFFEANLVTNANYMNNPSDYIDVNDIQNFYLSEKEKYIQYFSPIEVEQIDQTKVR